MPRRIGPVKRERFEERNYGVVSNNCVRNGGDGYSMFRDVRDAYDFGPDLADVTAEHGPYTPYTDGRIRVEVK